MTSVIGLDIGNLASKIGAARNRGIDILINEVSNRATPSLVAFGPKSRTIGEAAKGQETANFRNTVGSLKRLLGRSLQDPDVQDYEAKFINAELIDMKGQVGVKVNYLGNQTEFSATQLYAAFLGKLRDTAAKETKAAVNDVVIAVPVWYTDVQRRAVLDAAEIANLHVLKVINETTAIALGYGITKTDLPPAEEKSKNIVFVDIGHSQYSVTIVAFNKGQLVVKSTAYDRHFGGRDIDWALIQHFAAQFKEKYKIDVMNNKKALFRLSTAVEKLKKVLSANASSSLNVENIMNDIDASSSLTREDFEGLISPLLERTISPLETALKEADLSKDDIETVELIGGSTRIPALKNRIQGYFGRPLSFTCNQEEAVARGATLACATLSPVFRVREFNITDIHSFPIQMTWERASDDPEDGDGLEVFKRGDLVPSKQKVLTFYRRAPFALESRYSDPSVLPGGINPWIGRYTVKGVTPTGAGERSQVKIKVRLNPHGIFQLESATQSEEIEVDAPPAGEKAEGEAPPAGGEGDGEAAAAAAASADGTTPPSPKKTKKVIKKELSVVVGVNSLDASILNAMKEKEGEMHSSDRLVSETENCKNALEEYIYDMRDRLDGSLSAFAPASVKETLKTQLEESENWLYSEEGEDAIKSAYVTRLDALKKQGDPIVFRAKEVEARTIAAKSLGEITSGFLEKATSGDEKYSHIDAGDLQKVVEASANAQKWLQDLLAKQAERTKEQDPAVTSAEINKKREDVVYICTPILTKPKPKPKPEPTPEQQQPPKTEEADKKAEAATPEAEMKDGSVPNGNAQPEDAKAGAEMDVD